MDSDDGPPRDSDVEDTTPRLTRQYPQTPMPGDDESEPDTISESGSTFHGALKVLIIAIAIASMDSMDIANRYEHHDAVFERNSSTK